VHWTWTEQAKIKNLPTLLEHVRLRGGSIVQYDHVVSACIIGQRMPYYEWVGPGKSRPLAGVKHAALCLVLGWWSLPGTLWTPMAIAHNLTGGVDATDTFVVTPISATRREALLRERARQALMAKVVVALWVIGTVVAIWLSVRDDAPR